MLAAVAVALVLVGAVWSLVGLPGSAAAKSVDVTGTRDVRVAFIGDSYTVGRGATEPRDGWASKVSAAENWQEINFGISGSGYDRTGTRLGATTYLGRVPEVAELDPRIVVVSGGYNDVHHDDHAERGPVQNVYSAVRSALPNAEIVAIGPFWPHRRVPAAVTVLDAAVRAEAVRVHAFYISALDPNPLADPATVSADHIHPSDAGHAAIAAMVVKALAACRVARTPDCP